MGITKSSSSSLMEISKPSIPSVSRNFENKSRSSADISTIEDAIFFVIAVSSGRSPIFKIIGKSQADGPTASRPSLFLVTMA